MIVRSVDNRVIGSIDGRVFSKQINNGHVLRSPPALAIDAEAFDGVIRPSCSSIIVYNTDTKKSYRASLHLFEMHKGVLDRGYGRQYYLTLNWWNSEPPVGQERLL